MRKGKPRADCLSSIQLSLSVYVCSIPVSKGSYAEVVLVPGGEAEHLALSRQHITFYRDKNSTQLYDTHSQSYIHIYTYVIAEREMGQLIVQQGG